MLIKQVNIGGKMKKSLMLMVMITLLISSFSLFADEEVETVIIEKNLDKLEEGLDKLDSALEQMEKDIEITNFNFPDQSNRARMGVFLSNLDFQDAYELHYNYNYGVLITAVSNNGPAQKAGIMGGDIIMEIDGVKARYEDHLVRLIKQHAIGSEAKVKFYRDEMIYETDLIFSTLETEEKKTTLTKSGKVKQKTYVGDGGGSWYPIWYMPDLEEFNSILADFGFKEETFSEDGFLIQGGGGMVNVGKNWFIGGMGAGYENKETTKHNWIHYTNEIMDTSLVSRKVKYFVNYGGVTLDKRFPVFKNLTGGLGFMLGVGKQGFKITQSDDNGSISNLDFDSDISGQFDQFYDYKSKLTMKKKFILFQPKITFLYQILDWLHIRAEAGYMISHSTDGWVAKRNGEKIKIENAPDLNMDGLTVSIGPWFGF